MSELKAEMKFEIGQLVYAVDSQHCAGVRPRQLCITERAVQECHGGVQRLYRINGINEWMPEIALTADEPPYRPRSAETLEAMDAEEREIHRLGDARFDERRKRWKTEPES